MKGTHSRFEATVPYPIGRMLTFGSLNACTLPRLFLILHRELVYIHFTERTLWLKTKREEKLIGHHTRLCAKDGSSLGS